MIITRSPLRITLGGGGTDLPSYYTRHTGFLIAAAIDKYVYVALHRALKPSGTECDEIMREAMRLLGIAGADVEMHSMADIPAGTGLGSSGSFTTALLRALHALRGNPVQPAELAEQACDIEINRLNQPVGKQDQHIAAHGGVACFEFLPEGRVNARPLKLAEETLRALQDNLLLFFTGFTRSASAILKDQDDRSKNADAAMIENLHCIKELAKRGLRALEDGDLAEFGALMDKHWQCKKERSGAISAPQINAWYDDAMKHGALGGKLVGAGGGGFLMFYAGDKAALRHAMRGHGLEEVRFRFDFEGTKVIVD